MRALVIEGGSMRAAYANGVLAAFEEAGFGGFDAVYGTSAGGALAGWWSAAQARFAATTWRYAQDRRILSWRRWTLGRGPLLDHDALFRIVYETEAPLDVKRVQAASHPVVVTVTPVDTGDTEYVDVRKGPVLAWLRATGRMPVACGPPVEIDGRQYLDGGLTDAIPIRRALDDGADDVVVVLNRPPAERRPEPWVARKLVARSFPHLEDAVARHHEDHNESVRLALDPPRGVRVRVVHPATPVPVSRFTRDLARIDAAIAQGRSDGARFVTRQGS